MSPYNITKDKRVIAINATFSTGLVFRTKTALRLWFWTSSVVLKKKKKKKKKKRQINLQMFVILYLLQNT